MCDQLNFDKYVNLIKLRVGLNVQLSLNEVLFPYLKFKNILTNQSMYLIDPFFVHYFRIFESKELKIGYLSKLV